MAKCIHSERIEKKTGKDDTLTAVIALTTFQHSPERLFEEIARIPGVAELTSALHQHSELSMVLYGGAVLDILLGKGVSNDLDFLLEYAGPSLADIHKDFLTIVSSVTKKSRLKLPYIKMIISWCTLFPMVFP